MGTRNIRASQSPLEDKCSYFDNGMYEESKTVYCYICNELFLIGKDDFEDRNFFSLYKLFRNR